MLAVDGVGTFDCEHIVSAFYFALAVVVSASAAESFSHRGISPLPSHALFSRENQNLYHNGYTRQKKVVLVLPIAIKNQRHAKGETLW